MRRILAASVLSLSLLAMPAFAALQAADPLATEGFSAEAFGTQRAAILADLERGERYAEIKAADRDTVLSLLARMEAIIAAAPTVDALDDGQRVELFNAQERVNTLLTQAADDSRMLCEQRSRMGSHRRTTNCETVAQRRARREQDQNSLRFIQRPQRLRNEGAL
jgi:hypothetical protein